MNKKNRPSKEPEYTIESALIAHSKGDLKGWVMKLLVSEKSFELAKKIDLEKIISIEMYDFPLALLKKIQGPEENEMHRQSPKDWEEKVKNLTVSLKEGHAPAPLIVTDFWNHFEVADGNHRHEALERLGIKSYWTIFLIKHAAGKKYLKTVLKDIA